MTLLSKKQLSSLRAVIMVAWKRRTLISRVPFPVLLAIIAGSIIAVFYGYDPSEWTCRIPYTLENCNLHV